MNPNEDTEWNDILRAKGILPPKEGPTEDEIFEDHDRAVREAQEKNLSDKDLDSLDELEDEEDEAVLRMYRQKRMDEIKALADKSHYGELVQISEPDYKKQVTEASKEVSVVVHLFRDSIPACKLMNSHLALLAHQYPTVKFIKIISTDCIHNYPDRNLPTLLLYNHGDMQHQLVGIAQLGGLKMTVKDLERYLVSAGSLPDQGPKKGRSSDGDDSDNHNHDDSDSDY